MTTTWVRVEMTEKQWETVLAALDPGVRQPKTQAIALLLFKQRVWSAMANAREASR